MIYGTRTTSFLSLTGFALLAVGCSVHPLPKEVSRHDTAEIVRNIRCEVKFKAIERVRELLQNAPHPIVRKIRARHVLEEENLNKIAKYHVGGKYLRGVDRTTKDLSAIFAAFRGSAISYDFEFMITETNNASAGADFQLPFLNGLLKTDVGASLDKTRLAERKFSMQETFEDLIKLRCRHDSEFFPDGHEYVKNRKSLIYPLTGSIGMDKIMDTFLDLGALGGKQGAIFTDTLTFTTTAAADAGLTVENTKFPLNKLSLVNATAELKAGRTDIHKVTISIAFPTVDHRNPQMERRLQTDPVFRRNTEKSTFELLAYETCVQSNRTREAVTGDLREYPPEMYCLNNARRLTKLRFGNQTP